MKSVKKFSFVGLCLILAIAICSVVMAQPQRRGNIDPTQMVQMMVDRATTNLGLTADEAQVIIPKIEKILKLRISSSQDIQPLQDDMMTLLNDSKTGDRAIKVQLDKLKAKAADIKKATDAAEKELKDVVTIRQEAQLTMSGILSNGMGMMFGRGLGGGGRGGAGGPGGGGGGRGGAGGGGGGNQSGNNQN